MHGQQNIKITDSKLPGQVLLLDYVNSAVCYTSVSCFCSGHS